MNNDHFPSDFDMCDDMGDFAVEHAEELRAIDLRAAAQNLRAAAKRLIAEGAQS